MARFSERIGAVTHSRTIQLASVDEALRNSLWNEIYSRFQNEIHPVWDRVAIALAQEVYKLPVDSLPRSMAQAHEWVRQRFFEASWHEMYDLLEFLVRHCNVIYNRPSALGSAYLDLKPEFLREVNAILERELSAYRFISGQLAPITDPTEVAAIEEASAVGLHGPLGGVSEHIRAALELLGRKPDPDYRNSIKESISAVESAVNAVTGAEGSGVAKAVELLATRVAIHPSLRASLKQLYGFTSNADGIRHAILEQSAVGFAEAKFMLVACSAFTNFLVSKADEAGFLK